MERIHHARTANRGDLVMGFVVGRSGTKVHVARLDHRYGAKGDLVWVRALCGRRGRLEPFRGSDAVCGSCHRAAVGLGINLNEGTS